MSAQNNQYKHIVNPTTQQHKSQSPSQHSNNCFTLISLTVFASFCLHFVPNKGRKKNLIYRQVSHEILVPEVHVGTRPRRYVSITCYESTSHMTSKYIERFYLE